MPSHLKTSINQRTLSSLKPLFPDRLTNRARFSLEKWRILDVALVGWVGMLWLSGVELGGRGLDGVGWSGVEWNGFGKGGLMGGGVVVELGM